MAEQGSGGYYVIYGLKFFSGSVTSVIDRVASWIKSRKRAYICVTGAHGVVESKRRSVVLGAHQGAGLIVPDGMPMVWLGKLLGYPDTKRIYGPDLFLALCMRAEKENWRVFLYGTTDSTLQKLKKRLLIKFPRLIIVGCIAPPFRPLLPKEEKKIVTEINKSGADIVFVGLSTPKQELWMQRHNKKLQASVQVGVGAAFDFVAGIKKQAPVWMRGVGLEWFFRFMQEPRRLWYRYTIQNVQFVCLALQALVFR